MLPYSIRFKALGTEWRIDTEQEITEQFLAQIHVRIEAYDQTYSRFRSDSLVTQMAQKKGLYTFPDDASHIIGFYRQLYTLTDGKVTPLIGSVLERAGYDAEYSFSSKPQEKLPTWDKAFHWHGNTVETTRPVTLDIGAAGKGYLVDIIACMFDGARIKEYVIDASGDLRHNGTHENRVGLEHPFEPEHVIGVIDVKNKSLCASATTKRTWGSDMHHIFDPDELAPVRQIVATWVVASEAMVADGLATALFFVDPKVLAPHYDFQYIRMHSDSSIDYSHDFKGELFT